MSKTDGKWFSHDNNTLADPKIVCLEAQYGFEGSGRFWRLMETIHTQEGYKYSLTQKVAYASLAMTLRMSIEELRQFLHYLIDETELIQTDGEYIWNDSMLRRMEYWDKRKEVLSERGKKGAATTNAKKAAQANLEVGTSAEQADDFSTNKTKQNETKPNNTNNTIVVDDTFLRNNKGTANTTNHTVFTLSELRDRCADDVEFCTTYTQLKKIPFDKLYAWLNAFNKWLVYTADTQKDESAYRKHFRNWFHQRTNWQHENPETYNPVADQSFSKQPQRAIPLEMPRKTAQQALAEREAAEREFINQSKAM